MADKFPEELAEGRDIDELSVATIRALAIDGVREGQLGPSGHASGSGAYGARSLDPPSELRSRRAVVAG